MVSRQTDRISQPWATTVRRRSPSTPHRPTWARALVGNSVLMPKIKTRSDYFLWNQFLNPWNCMFSESWFLRRTYYLGMEWIQNSLFFWLENCKGPMYPEVHEKYSKWFDMFIVNYIINTVFCVTWNVEMNYAFCACMFLTCLHKIPRNEPLFVQ